jgi:hypothetical protein
MLGKIHRFPNTNYSFVVRPTAGKGSIILLCVLSRSLDTVFRRHENPSKQKPQKAQLRAVLLIFGDEGDPASPSLAQSSESCI